MKLFISPKIRRWKRCNTHNILVSLFQLNVIIVLFYSDRRRERMERNNSETTAHIIFTRCELSFVKYFYVKSELGAG